MEPTKKPGDSKNSSSGANSKAKEAGVVALSGAIAALAAWIIKDIFSGRKKPS